MGTYSSLSTESGGANFFFTQQICRTPTSIQRWDNSTGWPVATGASPPGDVFSYSCPSDGSANPYDLAYPYGTLCVENMNPDIGGIRNFDNILFAWIAIYQHMMIQDWSFIMYNTQAALSWWTWILHVSLVLIGGACALSLVFAADVIPPPLSSDQVSSSTT